MAHYAELDENNNVLRVIVVPDLPEDEGEQFCVNLLGGRWKKTSYNTRGNQHTAGGVPFRKNYAGIGYHYDEEMNAFIPPRPYSSWAVNPTTGLWEAPIPKPKNGAYYWNENIQQWVAINLS